MIGLINGSVWEAPAKSNVPQNWTLERERRKVKKGKQRK